VFSTGPSEEKEEEEKHFGHLATFRFGTFMVLFHSTRHVIGHEAFENEWHVIKAYKFNNFERFFVLSYIACPRYPYIWSLLAL